MRVLLAVGALVSSMMLTGCADPCAKLAPGNEEQKKLVQDGFELEKETGGSDCVMQGDGSWTRD